jgi:hypothetical protein
MDFLDLDEPEMQRAEQLASGKAEINRETVSTAHGRNPWKQYKFYHNRCKEKQKTE